MLFNTLQFALFFAIIYSLYLLLDHQKQNRMLLAASYFFYGYWDWRFLSLLLLTTTLDYYFGNKIAATEDASKRKQYVTLSVCANLGILGFFKYFNFFADSLKDLFGVLGFQTDIVTLKVLLPIGISFYTFQSMGYVIDVYRRDVKPAKNFLDFALYTAYFPHLVAGPIMRATTLLPQVENPRILDKEQIRRGIVLILWGLFKKVIVADNMASIANPIFAQNGSINGAQAMIGIYAFAFQIYGDFSGYSDIARGLSKMMGFELMLNFNLPYFAKNPQDFWRRWHISFSTWLRDYLYIPLGGNKKGSLRTYINLMLTMLLGGLWHGAAWTFVIWGAFHGVLLSLHRMIVGNQRAQDDNGILSALKIVGMFHLTCFGWLIFRARSLSQILSFLKSIFSPWEWDWDTSRYWHQFTFYVSALLIVQIIQYTKQNLNYIYQSPKAVRISVGTLLMGIVMISLLVGLPNAAEFIYFQF